MRLEGEIRNEDRNQRGARMKSVAEQLAENESLLCEATQLAWRWHGHQTRKGKAAPYVSHLLQVQGLVIEHGGNCAQTIAALLHDSLEDAETPAEREERETTVGSRFEPAVLRIVLDCTDTTALEAGENKGPWRARKERYVAQLEDASAESLLVAACDKRHNLGDLVGDLRAEGMGTLARFNAGPREQLWYFESLDRLFQPHVPTRLAGELGELLDELRSFVEAAPQTNPEQ
jgi:(p)ppGpp synthase/HD superfamily hydrolase